MDTDVPPVLLPCAICARTFMPQSLEKHSKICLQSVNKKRKPFDSAKQRIRGTELAEFLPKQERKRHSSDDRSSKPKSTWKETHDDFLRAIRAARNEVEGPTMQRQGGTTITQNAPTRANEQGTCPTCQRHFGVKAYDRHVAWCKERIVHVTASPATSIAKERLEARMKYRAPSVKNRRQTTREKYSPSSTIALNSSNKTSPTLVSARAKESNSAPSCNKNSDSPVKQKIAPIKRSGQTKESTGTAMPMKSRPMDRGNRPPEDEAGPVIIRPAIPVKRISHLPVPPLKHKRVNPDECNDVALPVLCKKQSGSGRKTRREGTRKQTVKQEEKHQSTYSARSQKVNIVSARSQGSPKVNDVSINEEFLGVTVKPCKLYREMQFTTWKQIGQGNSCLERDWKPGKIVTADSALPEISRKPVENLPLHEEHTKNGGLALDAGILKQDSSFPSLESESINWPPASSSLNRTYSFRDSTMFDDIGDMGVGRQKKWKPVKHSPRVEFCLGDPEKAIRVYDRLNELNHHEEARAKLTKAVDSKKERSASEDAPLESKDSRDILDSMTASEDAKVVDDNANENVPRQMSSFEQSEYDGKLDDCETKELDWNTDGINNNAEETNDLVEDNMKSPWQMSSLEQSEYDGKLDDCETKELDWNTNDIDNDAEAANDFVEDNMKLNNQVNEIIVDCNNQQECDEFDVHRTNSVQSGSCEVNHSIELRDDNDMATFLHTETDWIEMETEPLFEQDSIKPTRSSTPFVENDDCSNSKFEEFANLKVGSLENFEWKMEVDGERKSEVLYRVESRDSNRSSSKQSSRSLSKKLEQSNSVNDTPQLCDSNDVSRNASPPVHTERKSYCITPSSGTQERENNLSGIASPAILQEAEEKLPKMFGEEAVCQINIRNSPMQVCSDYDCDASIENVCASFAQHDSCCETQIYDLHRGKDTRVSEIVDDSMETQNETNLGGINCDSDLGESSTRLRDKSFEYSDRDCEKSNPLKIREDSANKIRGKKGDIREIYNNYTNQDFDYDSDDAIEQHMRNAINELKPSFSKEEKIQQNICRLQSIFLSESHVRMSHRVRVEDLRTNRSTTSGSRRLKKLEIKNRIRENMRVLNESSDSSARSANAVDFSNMKEVDAVEVETIEEIGTRNTSIKYRLFPEIRGTAAAMEENYKEKEKRDPQTYWEKASQASRNRLINCDLPHQVSNRFLKRNPKIRVLPPVPSSTSLTKYRGKDYDPFLLAEQQMNDLLSDNSEQSVTDCSPIEQSRDLSFPLSHSSAFVKYPNQTSFPDPEKRSSLIAPPTEFDDFTSDFSSDSTETNSLSREVFLKDLKDNKESKNSVSKSDGETKSPVRELGRRVIIDKSKALGEGVIDDSSRGSRSFVGSSERARKILDKVSPKGVRPAVNRSLSVRAASAPKTTSDRTNSASAYDKKSSHSTNNHGSLRSSSNGINNRNNNYTNLSSSSLSLSSIVSSDVDIKRSNSVFDELMTSFEDENGSFASLKSLLKNDSLSVSSPVHGKQRNGQISDEELSSPENYKRQDHSKMSADSAYSSLNRKYSHYGRSTNDVAGRFDEDASRNDHREGNGVPSIPKCKMSKFCHECGSKFPETAKFCCECGIKRLVL